MIENHKEYLDEFFNPGSGEDTDLCCKVENAGYKIAVVKNSEMFPIYHKGEVTVNELKNRNKILERNSRELYDRYGDKYISIIIPTAFDHLENKLKPCIESLIKYTDLKKYKMEIIIVANGCTDNTVEYIRNLGKPFRLIIEDKALGTTVPYNIGIKSSVGEYVILLNNDIVLLEQEKNKWLDLLLEPFQYKYRKVGMTGVMLLNTEFENIKNHNFKFFSSFCVCSKKDIFNKVGYLGEELNIDKFSDVDFSQRLIDNNYELISVPIGNELTHAKQNNKVVFSGHFPIFHSGGVSSDFKKDKETMDYEKFCVYYNSKLNLIKDIRFQLIILTCSDNVLLRCLDGIVRYTTKNMLNTISFYIIGNNSEKNDYLQKIKRFCIDNCLDYNKFHVELIPNLIPASEAYNIGFKRALKDNKGENIILLNDDILLLNQRQDEWIDFLYEPFKKNNHKIGITGPVSMTITHMNENKISSINGNKNKKEFKFCEFICCMINPRIFDEVGFIDEEFGKYGSYCDDIEFCFRVQNAGYDVICVPNGKNNWDNLTNLATSSFGLYHMSGVNISQRTPENLERAHLYLCEKHKIELENKDDKPLIIDTFMFFNELDVLKIRLEELYDVVDKFILVESTYTFSGKEKCLYFQEHKHRFEKYLDKIEYGLYTPSEEDLKRNDPWHLESSQRNYICNILRKLNLREKDIILNSDVDEIPRFDTISRYLNDNSVSSIMGIELKHYYYYLNILVNNSWIFNYIATYGDILKCNGDLTYIRSNIRKTLTKQNYISNGGWHFGYLGGIQSIIKKIESFAHQEYNLEKYKDFNNLISSVVNLEDLFHCNNVKFRYTDIDITYPRDIVNNKEEYYKKNLIHHNYLDGYCLQRHMELQPLVEYLGNNTEEMCMVEIGCHVGLSTSFFASKFKRVYAVDPWKSGYDDTDTASLSNLEEAYKIFQQRCSYYNNIEVIRKSSVDSYELFDNESLDFVYIDGNHQYEYVLKDIKYWLPKIKQNGYIGGHDYCIRFNDKGGYEEFPDFDWNGVVKAVNEILGLPEVGFMDFSWCVKKDNIKKKINHSIIIPTCGAKNNGEYCIKGCLDSILKYTDFSTNDIDIHIVFNGELDDNIYNTLNYYENTYSSFIYIYYLDKQKMVGHGKATNCGIKNSRGKYLILLNDDCILLNQPINNWLSTMNNALLQDNNIGVVGPITDGKDNNVDYVCFACCMLSRDVINKVGYLNEDYDVNGGGGNDMDYCIRLKQKGLSVKRCGEQFNRDKLTNNTSGTYPLYHMGSSTLLPAFKNYHELVNKITYEEISKKYSNVDISKKYNGSDITVEISSKGRTFTNLPLLIKAISEQTIKPKKVVIWDDNENNEIIENMNKHPVYRYLCGILAKNNIESFFAFGAKRGQVINHDNSLRYFETDLIWRLDDDCIPENDTLEKLLQTLNENNNCAAVGGLILIPTMNYEIIPSIASNNIEYIYYGLNRQWFKHPTNEIENVDHLYCSFLFKRSIGLEIGGYCKELSIVGHREETMFTYDMKRKGYDILINPDCITWHMHEDKGGIRSVNGNYEHDEQIFSSYLEKNNIQLKKAKFIVLNNGMGDHFCFKHILDEVIEMYKDHEIIIASCYDDVFFDVLDKVRLISIAEAQMVLGDLSKYGVYEYGVQNNSKENLINIFRKIYL